MREHLPPQGRPLDGPLHGPHGGRTKQRAVYGKTREEVAQKLTKEMADRDGGIVYDAGKLTVGEYLDRWLSDSVREPCGNAPTSGTSN
jgi:hypothetical protein